MSMHKYTKHTHKYNTNMKRSNQLASQYNRDEKAKNNQYTPQAITPTTTYKKRRKTGIISTVGSEREKEKGSYIAVMIFNVGAQNITH